MLRAASPPYRWLCTAGVSVQLLWSAPLAAEEQSVTLKYDGPSGCGSEAEVRRRFEAALGGAAPEDPRVTATVTVRSDGATYTLHFRAMREGVESERSLDVDDCEAATEAAAVLLLLTVDPLLAKDLGIAVPATAAAPDAVKPPPSSASRSASAPEATTTEPATPERSPSRLSPFGGFLGVAATWVQGSTPTFGLGPALQAGVHHGPLELVLAAMFIPEDEAALAGVQGGSLSSSLLGAEAKLRIRIVSESVVAGPSAGVGVQRVVVAARGVSSPGSGATEWLSLSGGGFVSLRVAPRWAVTLEAAAVVPFQRPTYSVDGVGPVHQPRALGLEVFFGGSWLWGSQSETRSATD